MKETPQMLNDIDLSKIKVTMTEWATDKDWWEVKRRALITMGLRPKNAPDMQWKKRILKARHSPIRRIRFAFEIELPSYVATHLRTHIHAQPYIGTQRIDRQKEGVYVNTNKNDRETIVPMIFDVNGEEIMEIANKRLCNQADKVTQYVVKIICQLVLEKCPEYEGLLIPMCLRLHECPEMCPCKEEVLHDIGV